MAPQVTLAQLSLPSPALRKAVRTRTHLTTLSLRLKNLLNQICKALPQRTQTVPI
jgi:hypothetical protein